MPGGIITARGGDGGKGFLGTPSGTLAYASGSGGGGSGGTIVLISGASIDLGAATVDAGGGLGGARADTGSATLYAGTNAGGDGGRGFIFLMDDDGVIDGYANPAPGDYDTPEGFVRVSRFSSARFSSIAAITELFAMPAANPAYQPLDPSRIVGIVHPGQLIELSMSTSYADPKDPLAPDLAPGKENPPLHVATVAYQGGGVKVIVRDPMSGLNPGGVPKREAFLRVRADFHYTNGVEAALGPFASMDAVTVFIKFNE